MCSRVFMVVYMGLILATAGFCLTIAGWFTPSNNLSVYGVRRAGPVLLVIGVIMLIVSCLMCAIAQDRCCDQCVKCYHERRKRLLQRHLARAVADLHAAQNHVTHPEQLVMNNLRHTCEACHMERPNYVLYLPPGSEVESEHIHHNNGHSHYALGLAANKSPRLERILQMNQLRSSPHSYGYHESEGTTDSGETPSTVQIHNRIMSDPDGMQLMEYRPQMRHHSGPTEAAHLLDQTTSQSGTPPSICSPRWGLQRDISHDDTLHDSTDEGIMSTPTTSPMVTPSSSRKYSVTAALSPNISACGTTKELLAAVRALPDAPDPVWTPRASRWGTSPLATVSTEENAPPPPYKYKRRHHSDV